MAVSPANPQSDGTGPDLEPGLVPDGKLIWASGEEQDSTLLTHSHRFTVRPLVISTHSQLESGDSRPPGSSQSDPGIGGPGSDLVHGVLRAPETDARCERQPVAPG